MKNMKTTLIALSTFALGAILSFVILDKHGVTPQQMADAIYALKNISDENDSVSYTLLKQPKNQIEEEGLRAVVNNPEKPYYKFEQQGDKHYFYAFYPDGKGAIVIRIKLNQIQARMGGIRG